MSITERTKLSFKRLLLLFYLTEYALHLLPPSLSPFKSMRGGKIGLWKNRGAFRVLLGPPLSKVTGNNHLAIFTKVQSKSLIHSLQESGHWHMSDVV